MLEVTTATKNTYIQSESLHKELRIVFTKGNRTQEVGNSAIVAEEFELEQNLCDSEVDFMGCVGSTCRFTLWNVFGTFDVKTKVQVYVEADGTNEEILIFTGYINEVSANLEDGQVEYICYDLIAFDYLSNWKFGDTLSEYLDDHSSQGTPITEILTLMERSSTQYGLEITYEGNLPNNNAIIKSDGMVDVFKGMSALDVLKYICQIEGAFGVINNEGEFELRWINASGEYEGAYPGTITYPSETLYPGVQNAGQTGEFLLLPYESFESAHRLTKSEPPINGVLIMETDDANADKSSDKMQDVKNYDDSDMPGGNGTPFTGSVIKIVGNPFVHNRPSSYKLDVCNKIQSVAGGFVYYPYEAKGKGLPFIEVGDFVDYIVTNWNETGQQRHQMVTCLVSKRTLKGIQHMTDTYSAQIVGDWKREEKINYICALGGASAVSQDIEADQTDSQIDEKIEEVSNIWNVETVVSRPDNPRPKTIYFVRGIVNMHGYSESNEVDEVEVNNGENTNEGQTE